MSIAPAQIESDLTAAYLIGLHSRDDEISKLKAENAKLRAKIDEALVASEVCNGGLAAAALRMYEILKSRDDGVPGGQGR